MHSLAVPHTQQVQGLLWNIGNVASFVAVDSPLGMTVAYPVSQCALLIAATWGVLYYREIRNPRKIATFAVSAVVICLGATLLGVYGSCVS